MQNGISVFAVVSNQVLRIVSKALVLKPKLWYGDILLMKPPPHIYEVDGGAVYCGISMAVGSIRKRGVSCMATGLGSRRQRVSCRPADRLSLDRRWQGGLPVGIFQQLGQQDSPYQEVSEQPGHWGCCT